MSIGVSLFLIAVGAILRYAVTENVSGIDLPTVGLILMLVGILGLVISIAWMVASARNRTPPRGPTQPPPGGPYQQ